MHTLLHIVFGASSRENLEAAFEKDETLKGTVLTLQDNLAVGPIFIFDTPEGKAARTLWWQEVWAGHPQAEQEWQPFSADATSLATLVERLQQEANLQVWIWAAQNARDVCGYYWLISQLADFHGRIHVIHLNNLPFLNENGCLFYPTLLSEIPVKEFLKARKLARPVSLSEFEMDGDEWKKLMNENAGIRSLEGGKKLKGLPTAAFDEELISSAILDFQKAQKLIQQCLQKNKQVLPEQFLCWRLKELIKAEKLEYKGALKTSRDFEVKLKQAVVSA